MLGEDLEVPLGREAVGLAGLGLEVERDQIRRAGVVAERRAQLGDEQVRDHAGEPRARDRAPPSRRRLDRGHGLGAGGRVVRLEVHLARRGPMVEATSTCPAHDVVAQSGSPGTSPTTSAAMSIGVTAIGSTRPSAPSSRAHPVEALDVAAEQLPERDDQQVAHRVVVHLAVAAEPVLEHPRPGLPPVVVAAESGQRHPEVTRRQRAELGAQAGPSCRRCRRR